MLRGRILWAAVFIPKSPKKAQMFSAASNIDKIPNCAGSKILGNTSAKTTPATNVTVWIPTP
ncbi:Uncharacterised protein [Candidatus Gugararchaeum adminiculabundum]|nr:Uncharacterised protein [Candidatus Gugararchaeum adminiculabundum]